MSGRSETSSEADSDISRMRSLRWEGGSDGHRPRYHLTAPSGWLNDPNGVIHWRGDYHLFYQHNPRAAEWGPPSWGHVVSSDLVHWRDQPLALTPEMAPPDDGGCWSGCAVDDHGTPTLVYTGVKGGEQTTCLAFGDDTLTRWRKHAGNPVLGTPGDLGITEASYRDPYVWREGESWYQVVGVSQQDRGGVLLYRSDDLLHWQYLGPLLAPEIRDRYEGDAHTWECPNFFALGDRHVLIVSLATRAALAYPIALIGEYRDHRFVPERVQRLDWGFHCFYAPLTLRDAGGRRLIWGWLQEQRDRSAQLAAGWSGAMSLPRELTLSGNGSLRMDFVPELATLRGEGVEFADTCIAGVLLLGGLAGSALELRLELRRGTSERSGIILRHSGSDETRLTVDWRAGTLALDLPGVSTDGELSWKRQEGSFERLGERVSLHLHLDHSTLEVIADRALSLSGRVYPAGEGGFEIALFSDGGEARAERLEGWRLGSIW